MGQSNSGGTTVKIWLAKVSNVLGLDLPANPVNPSDIPKIALADLTITGLQSMEIREFSGAVNHEKIGEVDGRSFKNVASFELSGTDEKVIGFQHIRAAGSFHLTLGQRKSSSRT
jgi:hypothetical protein